MSEQDYTILSNENLDIKVDDDQISGSNLFIQAKDLTAQSGVAGFEKFAPIKAFSESFRNNIRKDSKQKSASVGGTINSGFIEVYIPESIFSLELQKKGLSADPIPQITVMKTVLVKNTRTAVTQLFYTDCNIVYVASPIRNILFYEIRI